MILLSLPPYPDALKGFNFSALEPIVDFFPIYSFNYGFHSLPVVKQNSPLFDQKHIVESIVAKQGSYSKLIIGVSSDIEYFVLSDKKNNKVGAPQKMWKGGWMPLAEGCKRIRNGSYLIVRDPYASNYATLNTEWFSFEDYASMERKADFVKRNNIAGMWIKYAVCDDYNGDCGCGIRPFTRMVAELLRAEGGCTYVPCP
ncbi:probable chitinase 10 [Cloeon dipterum]|uniref:probable chitinase 10 n=1 Tax=Cloeon dipterum TaxID=197152 RepID=UPI0032209225